MRFLDLEDHTAVMPFFLLLVDKLDLRKSRWGNSRFRLAIFCMISIVFVPKMFLGYRDDFRLMLRGVSELIFQVNIALKMLIFVWREGDYEQMLIFLRKWFRKSKLL